MRQATAMPVAVPSVPPVPPPAAGPELVSRAVSVQEDLLSRLRSVQCHRKCHQVSYDSYVVEVYNIQVFP